MDRSAEFGAADRRAAGSLDSPCPYPGDEWRELPTKEQQKEERPRSATANHRDAARWVIPKPQPKKKRAVEMPGLWKAWKAKSRLPTLSTSPLEISPKGGEISTFPQPRRSGPEKWKTQKQVFHFPLPLRDYDPRLLSPNTPAAFGRGGGAPRRLRSNCR